MVRVWKNEYEVLKTKHVQALNSNYLFIERVGKSTGATNTGGLYYMEIDFHEVGPSAKLTDYIDTHSATELKPIVEYPTGASASLIDRWDVSGTPFALAVSFVSRIDPAAVKVILKVLNVFGDWAICQEDVLVDTPTVYAMEMISPPIDPSKVFVLYSTDDGLDGGKH